MIGLKQDNAWSATHTGQGADGAEESAPIDLTELRSAPRFTLLIRAAKLTSPDGEFLCVMRDVSETGVSVRLFHPLPAAAELALELPNGDRHPLERVWESDGKAGFRFRRQVELESIVEGRSDYAKRPVRLRIEVPCWLVVGARRVRATIGNLSQQGALVSTQEHLSLVQRVRIEVEGLPGIAARVRWRHADRYGLSFEDTFQFAELAALAFDLQRAAAQVTPRTGGSALPGRSCNSEVRSAAGRR